jgi:hypothetical protein
MSNSPIRRDGLSESRPIDRISRLAASARERLPNVANAFVAPARALAFWSAIALPALNVALLIQGLSTPAETLTFLALLATNVFALLVGHPHHSD